MKYLFIITILVSLSCLLAMEVTTASNIDLKRYAGKWYEVARTPNPFQRACSSNTTAEYYLQNDKIKVINSCKKSNGELKQIEGQARVVNKDNSKLKVSFVRVFGKNIFWGDYWIIDIDDNYEWALVGEPHQRYAWILSRSQEMNQETLKYIISIAVANGYKEDKFRVTKQYLE